MSAELLEPGERLITQWIAHPDDEQPFRAGCAGLARVLIEHPSAAEEVLRAATRAAHAAKGYIPDPAMRMAELAADAFALIPRPRPLDQLRAAIADMSRAESLLTVGRPAAAVGELELARERLTGAEPGRVATYLTAALRWLTGRIDEEALERDRALAGYRQAAELSGPLVADAEVFVDDWNEVVQSPVAGVFEQIDETQIMRHTAAVVLIWSRAGVLRLEAEQMAPSERDELVEAVGQDVMRRYGFPPGFRSREFTGLLEAISRYGGGSFAEDVGLMGLGREKMPVYGAISRGRRQANDAEEARVYRDAQMKAGDDASAATVAREYLADFDLYAAAAPARRDRLAASSLGLVADAGGTLADKAGIAPVLETLLEHAIEQWDSERTAARRLEVSLLLEAAKQQGWESVAVLEAANAGGEPIPRDLAAMLGADDWLGRLKAALRRRPATAAIVCQSVGDRVMYACITARAKDFTLAWGTRDAIAELAALVPEELDFALLTGAPDSRSLLDAGRRAFEALPPELRRVIGANATLLIVPDTRLGDPDMPYELLHDGQSFLGLSHVIARAPTVERAARMLERTIPTASEARALVASAPMVEGQQPLLHALSEAEHVAAYLSAGGWAVAEPEEAQLEPGFLTRALGDVALAHLAAHGTDTAGAEALLLPQGGRLTIEDMTAANLPHLPFVYLNTCLLGGTRALGGGAQRGFAHTLIELGAPAVVANLLPVDDDAATQMAAAFYAGARAGAVGPALQRARQQLAGVGMPAVVWAATVLFGDPALKLTAARQGRRSAHRAPADRLLDMAARPGAPAPPADVASVVRETRSAQSDDPRLAAACVLAETMVALEGKPPGADDEPGERKNAAVTATRIGHGPSVARTRVAASDDCLARGEITDARRHLELALPALDALTEADGHWRELRQQAYASHHRVVHFERTGRDLLSIVDPSDPQAVATWERVIALHSMRERANGVATVRARERSLDDVLWNAVFTGRSLRAGGIRAKAEAAASLMTKLADRGALPADNPVATTILTGLLPLAWQRLATLDNGTVAEAANVLANAIADILRHWNPGPPEAVRRLESLRNVLWEDLELYETIFSTVDRWNDMDNPLQGAAYSLAADGGLEHLPGAYAYTMGMLITSHERAVNEEVLAELAEIYQAMCRDAEERELFGRSSWDDVFGKLPPVIRPGPSPR